jgi:YidC/Oxa1 family membrane protein insertase
MDKRSILAIAITFLVLLLWQAIFIAPKQREYQRRQAVELQERKRADSLAALARAAAPAETLAATKPAAARPAAAVAPGAAGFFAAGADTTSGATITILTDELKAVLSSRGGELRRVELLHFLEKNKKPVELIPAGASGGFELSFLENGAWQGLSRLAFDATVDGGAVRDSAEVILGQGKDSVIVVFSRKGASGEFVEKQYTFHRKAYAIGLAVAIEREGALASSSAYAVGWSCGLASTEPDKRADYAKFAAVGGVGADFYKVPMVKFSKDLARSYDGTVVWAGARTKYFLSAVITKPGSRNTGTLTLRGNRATDYVGYSIGYPFRGDPRHVADSFTAYVGPLDLETLKSFHAGIDKAVDIGRLRFFSIFILKFMIWMKRYIPNYGVIIIILSVMTKLLFYRLTHKSFKSMKDMQRIQPRMKELQEKYKDNRAKLNEEMMKLYKEAGVNPLGGCLPLLLQMPVFWALFNVLSNTIELRNAPFVGWINDLSSPDNLFSFGATIPFLGSNFHLLPILMGAAMVFQTKLGGSPTGDGTPAAAQTKMMNYLMPILFTVIFYGMPSGLVLYWLVNNVLSIVQQYGVQKQVEAEDALKLAQAQADGGAAAAAAPAASSGRTGGRRNPPGRKSKRPIVH